MTSRFRNLLRGASSLFELAPPPRSPVIGAGLLGRTDAQALAGDWNRVGGDMRAAFDQVIGRQWRDGPTAEG